MATLLAASQLAQNTIAPPYLPFARLLESLDGLAVFMPPRIDRSLWSTESPYLATVLANAYGFLKLIDPDGAPTSVLRRLATDIANRPAILREVLEEAYGDLLRTSDIDQALSTFPVSGATHRKAISFLVQACRYAGIPLSKSHIPNRLSHTKSTPGKQQPGETTMITIALESGGEITLSGRLNPFTLSSDDRRFVFKLVDELAAYSARHSEMDDPPPAQEEVPF